MSEKQELKINITEISTKPWIANGGGSWKSSCYIKFEVSNTSIHDNEISATIQTLDSSTKITEMKRLTLPKRKTSIFHMDLSPDEFNSEEAINKYRGQDLLLVIKDIDDRVFKEQFLFEDKS